MVILHTTFKTHEGVPDGELIEAHTRLREEVFANMPGFVSATLAHAPFTRRWLSVSYWERWPSFVSNDDFPKLSQARDVAALCEQTSVAGGGFEIVGTTVLDK